ncbi:MAG: hypothetical protein R3B07_28300 [Polyangiaceae bacterium]
MKAAAPGKLVLSGAYAVLYGAPAVVTAVDRYVVSDSSRQSTFEAPEVVAAARRYPGRAIPGFDASELRSGDKKLGLGSSAAITVSAVALWELEAAPALTDAELAAKSFPVAFAAHREAQGGGSGVDVAAASFGGTLRATRSASGELELRPVQLPAELGVEVWWTGVPASTPALLAQVAALEASDPARFSRLVNAQADAAERTARAIEAANLEGVLAGLHAQFLALGALGEAANAPIVSPELVAGSKNLDPRDEVWLPAGAGGGDVLLRYRHPASTAAPPSAIERSAQRLPLELGARGVHFRP